MPMKNPVHPGRILREDGLAPLGLTVKAPPTRSARRARR
jgi:plasmid maintenance system antidote protein VapI